MGIESTDDDSIILTMIYWIIILKHIDILDKLKQYKNERGNNI